MCEDCVKHFQSIPPDIIQLVESLENDYRLLTDKAVAVLKKHMDIELIDVEGNGLDETDPVMMAAMANCERVMAAAYLFGWFGTSGSTTLSQAVAYMQASAQYVEQGMKENLSYTYVKTRNSH